VAERDGDSAFWSKVKTEDLPRCGLCDRTRHVEGADGRLARCPNCHPLQADPMPQARPRPGEPPPSVRTERWGEAAPTARRMLDGRPRPRSDPGAPDTGRLAGAPLARAPGEEGRAARLPDPPPDPPPGDPPDGDEYPF